MMGLRKCDEPEYINFRGSVPDAPRLNYVVDCVEPLRCVKAGTGPR